MTTNNPEYQPFADEVAAQVAAQVAATERQQAEAAAFLLKGEGDQLAGEVNLD
jgi:hypothetical protein